MYLKRTVWLIVLLSAPPTFAQKVDTRPPSEIFGDLFVEVQMQRVFDDGKTFVDMVPKAAPSAILDEYVVERGKEGFDLRAFTRERFVLHEARAEDFITTSRDVCEHIDALWPVLTRQPDDRQQWSSLLPLPHRYIVPGGRFREIYYWDSYFTMLGLEESGRHDLALDMVRNFAALIDEYGHIPNGNRTYYLSRSQPPFFAAMVDLLARREGDAFYAEYLPQLEREYAFWMQGAERVPRGGAHRRVVRLEDGTLLNRYWDDRDVPRDEAYREDIETASAVARPKQTYRHLRAAAESGWDFSSRWLADAKTLATIHTTDFAPVDLNSLLYNLEVTLAKAYEHAKKPRDSEAIRARADRRRAAIERYMWNARQGIYNDYLWRAQRPSGHITAAGLYPLYFGIASEGHAEETARTTRAMLLRPDGIASTLWKTGLQWDEPNGWPPLQWIAVKGLRDYGHGELAGTIAKRWIAENVAAFRAGSKLVEKYDVTGTGAAGGGEYPLQDGFGWTNGVLRKLLALYPSPGDCAVVKAASVAASPAVP
jgi:alpha,alpha-trehalase